jgi:hypothetical protein
MLHRGQNINGHEQSVRRFRTFLLVIGDLVPTCFGYLKSDKLLRYTIRSKQAVERWNELRSRRQTANSCHTTRHTLLGARAGS